MRENSINTIKEKIECFKNLSLAITVPSFVIIGLVVDYYYGIMCNYILCGTGVLSGTLVGIFLTFIEVIAWYNHPNTSPRKIPAHRLSKLIKDSTWVNQPVKTQEIN
ncbi:hypothetical protein [Candidatus Borrarchaeum sp.]|uniref:hypothetical protein n=1 Tax=Candidatus Borrarchaeum sp. TaxID=2846742 RepID=UPI00257B7DCB|nr:hypothetical protein [Candidatus Borrarchaeum sp.]